MQLGSSRGVHSCPILSTESERWRGATVNLNSATVRICVNGERETVASPATVASLIQVRGPRPPFAVEVNKRLVRRSEYEATALRDDDIVEIVTLVGGG